MSGWRRWIGVGVALGLLGALAPLMGRSVDLPAVLAKVQGPETAQRPPFDGLDLLKVRLRPGKAVAPLRGGKTAELTLDPDLQRQATAIMSRYDLPEAGTVLMDVRSGDLLVYASHVEKGEPFDVNARAGTPAASLFKVVTGSALVEMAGLSADTSQCYHGGVSRVEVSELEDDPVRDKWCATLAMAMGRSLNVVFARMTKKHLTPEELTAMAGALGFGAPIPFDVPNEGPSIAPPDDPTEFARMGAGFWHTTLSPLAAVSIAQTIASGGVTLRPRVVRRVLDGRDEQWASDSEPEVLRRALLPATAQEVRKMMLETVRNGSAHKAFHDAGGKPYLPGIEVAGKTGTLTDYGANRHYTWFIGFAPADKPEVAVAALVVNTPMWTIKGPMLARDVLRSYFTKAGKQGVTSP